MSVSFKTISGFTRPFILATAAATLLAGCASVTPNNSALLLETTAPTPTTAALQQSETLPSSAALYGQTVEASATDESAATDEPLEETIIEVNDPREAWNRNVNSFNIKMDRIIFRPVSKVYGTIVPLPLRLVVKNTLRHLEIPGDLINYALQRNGREAGQTLKRLVINSTLGVGGAFDVAGSLDIPYNPTDFGLTLANWGVSEGKYLVAPVLGPSTTRDGFGSLVDIAFRPQSYLSVITDFEYGGLVSRGVEAVDKRHRNGDLLDDVIFASPDPYVTLRSTYLQRRRALASDNVLGADGMEDALPVIATAGQ